MSDRSVRLSARAQGERLDKALADHWIDLSRTRIQALIRSGHVTVNGMVATKPGFRLSGEETLGIHLPPAEPVGLAAEAIPLTVVYEDPHVIVVNKPAGMVVHPAAGHGVGTLVNAVLAHASDIRGIGGELRPGIVHRLDKETSGLIAVAKSDAAYVGLQKQFKARTVEKTYLALVDGHPPTRAGRIEAPVGRDPRQRKKMAVVTSDKGRDAVSTFHLVKRFPAHSLLEVHPQTGRTHQIRVHLSFLGCPVVGDRVYGRRRPSLPVERHMLHAWRLRLTLPGEVTPRLLEAPLPADFTAALSQAGDPDPSV